MSDDFKIPFGSQYEAERLKAAVKRVFGNDHGIPCAVDISVSGFAPDEQLQINGKPLEAVSDEERRAVLDADNKVTAAEREVEAMRYLDPKTNPMIKLGGD